MNRLILVPLILFLGACGPQGGHDHEAEGEPGHDAEAEEAHVVHVEPADVENWGLQVSGLETTDITLEVQLPGVLTTNQNRTARIASLVEGQLAERWADLGDRVSQGETLAALNAPEFTRAQADYLQAFAQAELSGRDYERARVLADRNAIEEREFLRRAAVYEQELAELRAAEVLLQSLGLGQEELEAITRNLDVESPASGQAAMDALLPIRTPISGVIIQRDAVLGAHVEPGHPLFTVSDLSLLWARLDAYEDQMASLGDELDVVVQVPSLPGRSFPGRVDVIADQVDPELRTIQVRVEVPNPDGLLRPNMYVQGFLQSRSPGSERIVVPEDAIQLMEGRHVVFVEMPPEEGEDHRLFEEREVVPGETLSVGQVILEGLDGTERVVTQGAFTLKSEMTKGAGGHQHVH